MSEVTGNLPNAIHLCITHSQALGSTAPCAICTPKNPKWVCPQHGHCPAPHAEWPQPTGSLSQCSELFPDDYFTINKLAKLHFPKAQFPLGDLIEKQRNSTDHSPAEIVLTSIFLTDTSSSSTKCIRSAFDFWPSALLSKAAREDESDGPSLCHETMSSRS